MSFASFLTIVNISINCLKKQIKHFKNPTNKIIALTKTRKLKISVKSEAIFNDDISTHTNKFCINII